MKKLFFLASALCVSVAGMAQAIYYQDAHNEDMARHTLRNDVLREEFVLPKVNGYTVYKADLHSHTIYSDGSVSPDYRVQEAWVDGLDILAVTEHIEHRPWEGQMLSFLKGYVPEDTKAFNNGITGTAADGRGIQVDLNLSNNLAIAAAKRYGITIIPGIEITRNAGTIGHYNALFITDANTIYDPDPAQSMRNAHEQGALVMHNHPGWTRKNLDMTEFEKQVYKDGLIDGVEVMNGSEFYPSVINLANKNKLFMASNTDIHSTTSMEYNVQGHRRNMTFILAKDNSLEAIKEALRARRTLAYSYGSIAGEEKLVKDFFNACVTFEVFNIDDKGRCSVRMTNNSSVDFVLRFGEGNPVQLRAFTSRNCSVNKGKNMEFTVENMWVPGKEKHLVVKKKF